MYDQELTRELEVGDGAGVGEDLEVGDGVDLHGTFVSRKRLFPRTASDADCCFVGRQSP
jgi:hypothetical protein